MITHTIRTIAIQMDGMEHINPQGDTSLVLAREALRRGYRVVHFLPESLTWHNNTLTCIARPMLATGAPQLDAQGEAIPSADVLALGEPQSFLLEEADVVLIRQDPPFDMGYVANCLLLERLPAEVLVVNDPGSIRSLPEKISVLDYPDLTPPTMLTSSLQQVREFHAHHGEIIIKPLYGNGGSGVYHIREDGVNLATVVEQYAGRCPFIVQRFLPEVSEGDTRIILIEGEYVGALCRVPATGEVRANLHVGARAEKSELTPRMQEIIAAIGPRLRAAGILFAGIDVIGEYLTEINLTSPTGLIEIAKVSGVEIAPRVWDAIEARFTAKHHAVRKYNLEGVPMPSVMADSGAASDTDFELARDHRYRPCVGVVLLNEAGEVFQGARMDTASLSQDYWQFVQGGIDAGEEILAAAYRELEEETSILPSQVEPLFALPNPVIYDIPFAIRRKLWDGKFRGQQQWWWFFRFVGTNEDVRISTELPEFRAWRWGDFSHAADVAVPFKAAIYERLFAFWGANKNRLT